MATSIETSFPIFSGVSPEWELYLAITEEAEQTIFQEEIVQLILTQRIRRAFSVSFEREEILMHTVEKFRQAIATVCRGVGETAAHSERLAD